MIPVLDVRDVEASIEFYCDVLGFSVHDKVTWGGRTEWAVLRSGSVQLMLCAHPSPDADDDPMLTEGVFYLYHDNLESLMMYLGARGYDCRWDLMPDSSAAGGFFLRDPDGYVLWFSPRPLYRAEVGTTNPPPSNGHATPQV